VTRHAIPHHGSRQGAAARTRAGCAAQQRAPLTRERIVEQAMELIDGCCVEDLSMRRLGAELGVEAMALYWHLPNKAALMEAILASLLAKVELPSPGEADWQSAVRRYARSIRRLAAEHPRIFPLVASAGPRHPAIRGHMAAMRRLWRDAGFDEAMQFRAACAINGYVMGATLWGATPAAGGRRASTDEAFDFGLESLIRGLAAEAPH
jgi:TetR/AcrR family tetracycline transcriptional repressor